MVLKRCSKAGCLLAILSGQLLPACQAAPLPTLQDLLPLARSQAGDLLAQEPLTAEPASPIEPVADTLSEVTVTATRNRRRPIDLPTATTVITREQVRERSQTSLAELFKGEPGVYVRATNPSADSPVIRGVTGRDVLLLVDGFRLSHAFMRPNVQYQGLVDPYFAQQIEIVRGPGSVLYGSDALGGVTNVISPEYKSDAPPFALYTNYNTNPSASSTHLQFNGGNARAGGVVGLTYRTFGDLTLGENPNPQVFFPNSGRLIASSGYEFYGANARVGGELAPNQSFTLTAQYSKIPTVARQDGIIQGFGPNVASAERGFAPQSRTFLLGEYRYRFERSFLDDVRVKFGYQQVQDNRFQRNFRTPRPSYPGDTGIPSADTTLENNTSDLFGVITELRSTWGNQQLTYGVEAYFDRVSSARDIRNDLSGTSPDLNGPRYVNGSTLNQYGVFVQDEINWNERFLSVLGLRYSSVDVNVPFSTVRPNSSGFARHFDSLTASTGLLYRLTRDVNLVLNVGTGFRAPNVNDLAEAGERRVTDINIPNPDLRPEEVFSVDGGLKWSGTNFTGELFAFWSDYPNRIASESVGEVVSSDGTVSEIFQTQNRARESIWGIEFGGRYRFNPQWSVFSTFNYVYAALAAGESVIPPLNGVAGVRYELPRAAYVEPYIRYAGLQDRLSENNLTDRRLNPLGTPGFVLFNIRAGLVVNPTTTLRLNLDNLLNTSYREHGSSLDGAGISVSLGVDQTF